MATVVLGGVLASSASAAEPQTLWTRCNGGLGDVSCSIPRGISVAPATAPVPGGIYVGDQAGRRVVRYSAWGELLDTFGWKVNKTKVEAGAAEAEQNLCPVDPGDECQAGSSGAGPGQFALPEGVAVDSVGNVYAVDLLNFRVQKFDPEGHFLLSWGGPGTGTGEFGGWRPGTLTLGSYIAVGPGDKVYVGDNERIQVFDSEGNQLESLSLAGKGAVVALAAQSKAPGDLLVAFKGAKDVTLLSSAGAEKCTTAANANNVKTPTAVAFDAVGGIYAFDATDNEAVDPHVRKFSPTCEDKEEPFAEGEFTVSSGLAVGQVCLNEGADVYVPSSVQSNSFVRAYGPTPDKLGLCPKPEEPPLITEQYALSAGSGEATLRAEINPRFWRTTYAVRYATAACINAGGWNENPCVAERTGGTLGFEGDGAAPTSGLIVPDLTPATDYRFRFSAESEGGPPVQGRGGTPGVAGEEGSFRTLPERVTPFTDCPNQAYRTGPGALLADCRAYELVSPLDKEGSDIVGVGKRDQGDPTGSAFTYTAERRFGDGVSQPESPQYIASRRPRGESGEGWSSHGISPPRGVLRGGVLAGGDNEFKAFSEDLCHAWLVADRTTGAPPTPGGVANASNLYERSNCGAEADSYRALGAQTDGAVIEVQGASADGEEVAFRTFGHLSQEAASPAGSKLSCWTPTDAAVIAYRWLRDGAPIAGAVADKYTATAADAGKAIQCQVSASGADGGSTQVSREAWVIAPHPATAPPHAPERIPAPSASAPLALGGAGGQTLRCDPNEASWSGASEFAYRWYRNGAEISGASEPTHTASGAELATAALFQCEVIGGGAGGTTSRVSAPLATDPAPADAPPAQAFGKDSEQLYLAGAGGLRTVCALPGTRELSNGCSAGSAAGSDNGYESSVIGALAADGKRLYWSDRNSRLELRTNPAERQSALDGEGNCTEPTRACTTAVSAGSAVFIGADRNGSRAIYRSGLAKEATGDLFEYDAATGESRQIAGAVWGVAGMSEDARRIYFASGEECSGPNAEGKAPVPGEPNLYLYEEGEQCAAKQLEFVATLDRADAAINAEARHPAALAILPVAHTARVSAAGTTAAFMSRAPLTGYDSRDAASGEADIEVYRFRQGTGLDCVSCNPSGARPSGRHVGFFRPRLEGTNDYWAAARIVPAQHQLFYPRALSEDGDRLFFESFESLTLADVNGRKDVYEWRAPGTGDCATQSPSFSPENGGCIDLISSGQSPEDSSFLDATPSGADVFFSTAASLLPQDPALVDIYDARIGGGFPPPPEPPAPCEGEACQSPPAPPEAATPASAAFAGPGNRRPSCAANAARARRLARRARAARRSKAATQRRRARRLTRATRKARRAAKRCRTRRSKANAKRRAER